MAAPREKRARAEPAKDAPLPPQVALYTPFRALGYITNGVPFVLQTRFGGKDTTVPDVTVVTSIGDSWAMWNADKMTLLFVGPMLDHAISAMAHATSPDSLLVAAGPSVHRYVRGRQDAEYSSGIDGAAGHLASVLVFGDYIVSLAVDGRRAFVWSLSTTEIVQTIEFAPSFTASAIEHPATYLNKIVVASTTGDLQLWNVRTGSLIHAFSAEQLRGGAKQQTTAAGIVSMVQSPAIDVLAIAFADGLISLFDVRVGELLFTLHVEGGVGNGCLSFRTDGLAHTLAIATRAGSIVLFDLDAGNDGPVRGPRLLHSLHHAHEGAVGAIAFVPGQPLLISTGGDNALRQWFFESPTLPPRLLKARAGHYLPPHKIRYYGDDGRTILSASRDRSLRAVSIVRDSRSFELSQGSVESKANRLEIDPMSLKAPPVSSLSFATLRSRDWDDVLTTHSGDRYAHSWTVRDKRMNKSPLSVARGKKDRALATAACVSACGNFGLLGSSEGRVEMYNMQSHIHRRTFDTGIREPVADIATDALNRVAIVAQQDGSIHFFDFFTAELTHTISLGAGCSQLLLHRDSNLLAAAGDDLVLHVIDIETRRTVRRFGGFRGRILDVSFTADGRWLVACSSDSVVRTFDLIAAQLIDAFRTPSIATSVAFSPAGDFLATTHVDSLGIHLWVNRSQFRSIPVRALKANEERDAVLPTFAGFDLQDDAPDVGEPELQRTYTSPPQLSGDSGVLVTLSTMPRSRWLTLLHLDTIKQRNKPKEPPKKPEKAPFFIPQVSGIETAFDTSKSAEDSDAKATDASATNQVARVGGLVFESDTERRLREAVESKNVTSLFTYLHALSAPQLDAEIRSLDTPSQQRLFLEALALRLEARLDFEAVQAMLGVFFTCHSDSLIAQGIHPDAGDNDSDGTQLALSLRHMLREQVREGDRIIQSLDYCMGTLSFLRNVPLS
ncbi:rRNA-processing protein utp21 [Malassezia cuniculi]|uniref:rRNA-processing protein utp21 n=1 Tax=Malassezia cuniculi TaxID=948313 RepID=A0AAF0EP80_9BASI|nr:rRNA-processing protein utp21 [Malassezia cuniculi]